MTKATVKVKNLEEILHAARRVIKPRNIPILETVYLRFCADENLVATGSSLDVEMHATTQCEAVEGDFSICVNAARFSALVSSFDNCAPAVFELIDDNRVCVKNGNAVSEIPYLAPDEFPISSNADWSCEFEIPSHELKRILEQVSFSISADDTRTYLQGAFLHADGDHLGCVSSNGHAAVWVDTSYLPEGLEDFKGVLIPRETVALLINSLTKAERPVKVCVSENHIRVEFADRVILSRLLDGVFPEDSMRHLLSEKRGNVFTFNTADFRTMMKRVTALAGKPESAHAIITFEKGRITASCRDQSHGITTDFISMSKVRGKGKAEFKANSNYLIALTSLITAETTTISIGDPGSSILLAEDTFNDRMILMPMRM